MIKKKIKKNLLILMSLFILVSCGEHVTSPGLLLEKELVEKYGIDVAQDNKALTKQITKNLKDYFQETGSYKIIFTGTPREYEEETSLEYVISYSIMELALKNVTIDIDLRNVNFINGSMTTNMFMSDYESTNSTFVFYNYILPENKIRIMDEKVLEYNVHVKEMVIPDSVTEIGYCAMNSCRSLVRLTLSKNIKIIGYGAFGFIRNVKEIDTSHCSSLEYIDDTAFRGSGIVKFAIPDTVTFVGKDAFSDCKNLTTIIYYGDSPDKLKHADRTFQFSDKLTTLIVPNAINENDERWKTFLAGNFTTVTKNLE